jgi:ubiquinone/menaquinone biosynthesis C-methylase UbiE
MKKNVIKNIIGRPHTQKIQKLKNDELIKFLDYNKISLIVIYKDILKKIIFNTFRFINNLSTHIIKKENRHIKNVEAKYDTIAGSYIEKERKKNSFIAEINNDAFKVNGSHFESNRYYLRKIIEHLNPKSILEVGSGELTTFCEINKNLKKRDLHAIDVSWSRLYLGRKYANHKKVKLSSLSSSLANELPFKNNSIDLIYTSYCLEQTPNSLIEILREFERVSKKYVILLEPSFKFGTKLSRRYIKIKGYPRNYDEVINKTNFEIILNEPLPIKSYINGGELIILRKKNDGKKNNSKIVCPNCKNPLSKKNNFLICRNEKIAYPILDKIPLLKKSNGIRCDGIFKNLRFK